MNKPDCLRFSILELNKLLMDEFWNDNVKPKYGKNPNFVTCIELALSFM